MKDELKIYEDKNITWWQDIFPLAQLSKWFKESNRFIEYKICEHLYRSEHRQQVQEIRQLQANC